MPQIARSSGWSRTFTGLAVRSVLHLLLNIAIQYIILYQILLENNVMNLWGGQMHLCNFGQYFDQCENGQNVTDCTGPGGTRYTSARLYSNFQIWSTRVFVRDSLMKVLPE